LPLEQQERARNFHILIQDGVLELTNYFENEVLSKNGERLRMGWNCVPLKDSKDQTVGTAQVGEVLPSSVPSSPTVKRRSSSQDSSTKRLEPLFEHFSVSPHSEMVGEYILIRSFGRENTNVKLAIHSVTHEKVAIKFIPKTSIDQEHLQRSRREIQILKFLKTLDNPHIVKLIDSMETDTHLILIQELVNGGELLGFMQKNRSLPEVGALRIFRQILSALQCCHQHKIVHRDIKMQNILLDENNNIKLIDFGVSNFMEEGVFRTTFVGTPAYAPPEILLGENYFGPEVDIWSIGVVLYYMLTSKFPFPNIGCILKGKFHEPELLTPACLDLLRKMLTVSTKDRITLEHVLNHPWVRSYGPEVDEWNLNTWVEYKKRRKSIE